MSLVYSGVLSHAPGITGRAHLCENTDERDRFYTKLDKQRQEEGLRLILEQPNRGRIFVVRTDHAIIGMANVLIVISTILSFAFA